MSKINSPHRHEVRSWTSDGLSPLTIIVQQKMGPSKDNEEGATYECEAKDGAPDLDGDNIDRTVLKRYTLKCDLLIIPMVSFSYLLDSLDRSNLGNAHTAGITKDLGMHGAQYNMCLTAYYVAMIIFGPIGSILSKRLSGKYGIPGMLLGFGTASICTAAVKSFAGLLICRFFVGVYVSFPRIDV